MSDNPVTTMSAMDGAAAVTHGTFAVDRVYDASPERVFAAWSDPAIKSRWWTGARDADTPSMELDFRVGGVERASGGPEGGPTYAYEGCFRDIVAHRRIVLTSEMQCDGIRIAVGVYTAVFEPEGTGTRLTLTDQSVYLDDSLDKPEWRESGTRDQLEALAVFLKSEA